MSNSVSKLFAAFLALLLMYVVPSAELARRQDDLSRMVVYQSATKFVDSVRTKGYITPTMYNDFLRELEATGMYMTSRWSISTRSIIRCMMIQPIRARSGTAIWWCMIITIMLT